MLGRLITPRPVESGEGLCVEGVWGGTRLITKAKKRDDYDAKAFGKDCREFLRVLGTR